jgi:hypothetical protein
MGPGTFLVEHFHVLHAVLPPWRGLLLYMNQRFRSARRLHAGSALLISLRKNATRKE